jgi:hypothetical protein
MNLITLFCYKQCVDAPACGIQGLAAYTDSLRAMCLLAPLSRGCGALTTPDRLFRFIIAFLVSCVIGRNLLLLVTRIIISFFYIL